MYIMPKLVILNSSLHLEKRHLHSEIIMKNNNYSLLAILTSSVKYFTKKKKHTKSLRL